MKMLNWLLIVLVTVAIMSLSAFVIIKNKQANSDTNERLTNVSLFQSEAFEVMLGTFESSLRINNSAFNYQLEDIWGNKIDMQTLIHDGPRIVLRYSELNCNVCVDSALAAFIKFAKKVGEDNVIVLAEYKSQHYLAQFLRLNKITLPHIYRIVSYKNTALTHEANEAPFLFVLDKAMVRKDVFYPLKEIPILSTVFYETMYKKYFKQ